MNLVLETNRFLIANIYFSDVAPEIEDLEYSEPAFYIGEYNQKEQPFVNLQPPSPSLNFSEALRKSPWRM